MPDYLVAVISKPSGECPGCVLALSPTGVSWYDTTAYIQGCSEITVTRNSCQRVCAIPPNWSYLLSILTTCCAVLHPDGMWQRPNSVSCKPGDLPNDVNSAFKRGIACSLQTQVCPPYPTRGTPTRPLQHSSHSKELSVTCTVYTSMYNYVQLPCQSAARPQTNLAICITMLMYILHYVGCHRCWRRIKSVKLYMQG